MYDECEHWSVTYSMTSSHCYLNSEVQILFNWNHAAVLKRHKIRAYLTSLCYFSVLYRIVILNITLGYLTCNQLKMSLPPRLPCLEKAQKLINSFLLICEEGKVPRCEEIGRKEPLHSLGIQLMLGGVALSLTLLLGRGW